MYCGVGLPITATVSLVDPPCVAINQQYHEIIFSEHIPVHIAWEYSGTSEQGTIWGIRNVMKGD